MTRFLSAPMSLAEFRERRRIMTKCCVCGKDSTMEVKQGKEKFYFCAWMHLSEEAEARVTAVYSTPGGYYPPLPSEKRELDRV